MSNETENFLEHYGVKGMRWGYRKARSSAAKRRTAPPEMVKVATSKDGGGSMKLTKPAPKGGKLTSTPPKPTRAKIADKKVRKFVEGKASNREAKKLRNQVKKGRRTLSEDDLKHYIARLESEKRLKSLIEDDVSPGRKFVKQTTLTAGKQVSTKVAVLGTTALVASLMGKAFKKDGVGKQVAQALKATLNQGKKK